jgi:hypothetical protein
MRIAMSEATGSPRRTVHCADALRWLSEQGKLEGCSVVTSLPDSSEFPSLSLEEWRRWFAGAAEAIVERCPDDGVAIFYQTDVKRGGIWIEKSQLCQEGATRAGAALLFHKLVLRQPPGTITFGRPGYSHLLAFSRGVRVDLARSTPDVLPEAGPVLWTRGMGLAACQFACRFILRETATRTVVDPFCGLGTVLAVANSMGLDAIGVELSRKRAQRSRALAVEQIGAAERR